MADSLSRALTGSEPFIGKVPLESANDKVAS